MYDQDSKKVPQYYTRPGPGLYEVNQNLERLSKFHRTASVSIGDHSILGSNSPRHRFADFQQSILYSKLDEIQKKEYPFLL